MTVQQNILDRAKQGDSKAISTLMNRQLQPKGITAKANLKDECLQIMLESEEVPDQQALVAFIGKGVKGLGTEKIKKVKVYAKQTGSELPSWNQEFELSMSSPASSTPTKTKKEKEDKDAGKTFKKSKI